MEPRLAHISSAGGPGRRRQLNRRRGTRNPKRTLSIPVEIDLLINTEVRGEGRSYAAIVADRLRDSYERNPPANELAAN